MDIQKLDSLPKESYARKIVRLKGHSRDEAIITIASIDGVSLDVAASRYDLAEAQRLNRSRSQTLRQGRDKAALDTLRWRVLCICEAAGKLHCTTVWQPGRGLVEISNSLLLDLACSWKESAKVKYLPELSWIREKVIEQLHREGLILCGTTHMRITELGLKFIQEKLELKYIR